MASTAVIAFANEVAGGMAPREAAVALFYAVRERLRYNPWRVRYQPEDYTASSVVLRDPAVGGHCIDKALVLAACARALGIPSRLHFANVRNHIGTAKLEQMLGTDLLVFHGYAELYLEGRWVAATPAFNKELCDYLKVPPLEWDGRSHAILQAFSTDGGRFMEYVQDHGTYADVPHAFMMAQWHEHYPAVRNGTWLRRVGGGGGEGQ